MAFVISGIMMSLALVAMGMLIAFWTETYLRWVRWSVKNYAPWLLPRRAGPQRPWQFAILGFSSMLFGIIFACLVIWIHWYQ